VGLGEGRARRRSRRDYDGDLVGAPRKYYYYKNLLHGHYFSPSTL